MKRLLDEYDPLAPTPHREARDQQARIKEDQTLTTVHETATAERELRDRHDEELRQRHGDALSRWREEKSRIENGQEWNAQHLRFRGRTLDQEFAEHAKPQEASQNVPAAPDRDKTKSWRESANAQLAIQQDREAAMDRHDARWRMQENRLAAQSAPGLHPPGMGGDDGQSMKERFKEARERWEDQRVSIEDKFDQDRENERASGKTLSDVQRESAAPNMETNASSPSPLPEPEHSTAPDIAPEPVGPDMEVGGLEPHDPAIAPDFSLASGGPSPERSR